MNYFSMDNEETAIVTTPAYAAYPQIPSTNFPPYSLQDGINARVRYYLDRVIFFQYLLGENNTIQYIYDGAWYHQASREAICMLVDIHVRRGNYNPADIALRIPINGMEPHKLMVQLLLAGTNEGNTMDNAMASLHMISTFLFDGGGGGWASWLALACQYVKLLFFQSRRSGEARNWLKHQLVEFHPKIAFIVKTAIWFDVLASVTTQKAPHLMDVIEELYSPQSSGLEDIVYSGQPLPQSSMMTPMGCANHVVWALAKTSALGEWKQQQAAAGTLSIRDLVSKYDEIFAVLREGTANETLFPLETVEGSRYRASEIFRTSTILYLATVVSGDYPSVLDVRTAVAGVMCSLEPLTAATEEAKRRIVRSTVYSFFIAGCFVTSPEHQRTIMHLLSGQSQDAGNGASVLALLQDIWRHQNHRGPVNWQERLRASDTLLV